MLYPTWVCLGLRKSWKHIWVEEASVLQYGPSHFYKDNTSIREVKYTDWLANVVMLRKTIGKWRMYVDFTDLNRDCLKNNFPLPKTKRLVDSMAGFEFPSYDQENYGEEFPSYLNANFRCHQIPTH
jgi:hypothetical protein